MTFAKQLSSSPSSSSSSSSSSSFICLYVYNKLLKIYRRLLGEETSGNHQAYRRGHLYITILNKIRAATVSSFNSQLLVNQSQKPWDSHRSGATKTKLHFSLRPISHLGAYLQVISPTAKRFCSAGIKIWHYHTSKKNKTNISRCTDPAWKYKPLRKKREQICHHDAEDFPF